MLKINLNKKILNFRPFLFLAVSVALGIVSGYLFYFKSALLGVLTILVFILLTALFTFFTGGEIKSKLIFSLAFCLIFIFGASAFSYQVTLYDNADLNGHYYAVTGKVDSVYDLDYGKKLTLENVSIKGDRNGRLKYGVDVYAYGDCNFDIGDVITFDSFLKDKGAIYEDRLSATDIERGIKYIASVDVNDISLIDKSLTVFDKIHVFIRDTLISGMGEKESSVAYGLLVGVTEEMDYEVITSYRYSGVAHIFAVSGLHIGFLATVLNFLFNKLKVNRLLKAVIITLSLFFYSGVCGFSASSVRASVMSAVLLFSSVKGNRYDPLSSVGLACALLLICSPVHLFCVGFQLSFAVVMGIILFSPPLARLFKRLPKKLAGSLSTVISAQVVGIPICLYAFNYFSTVAIIANLIFIPVVGAIFIFLIVATLIGGALGVSSVTLFIPNILINIINIIITAIDYDIFLIGGFSVGVFAIFYYLALIIPSGLLNINKLIKLVASFAGVVACVVGTVAINAVDNAIPKAYVVGAQNACCTVIKGREENIMILSDAENILSLGRLKRLKDTQGVDKIDVLVLSCGQETDAQMLLTRLRSVFELEKVCYYGYTNTEIENIVRQSFGLNIRSFILGENLTDKSDCKYILGGYGVECVINGKKMAVFSKFGDSYAGYGGLSGEYDYMIAVDYAKRIFDEYKPKNFISYHDSLDFKSADSDGTQTLILG